MTSVRRRCTGQAEEVSQIESHVDKPFVFAAGSRSNQPDRPKGRISENKQEHKFMNQLNNYYDDVLKALQGADPLLTLGPGEAKGEFQKRLQSKKFPPRLVEIETADKMTDRQVAAKVREYYANHRTAH